MNLHDENALDALADPLDALKVSEPGAMLIGGLRERAPEGFEAKVRGDSTHPYVGRYPWMSLVMQSELHRQVSVGAVRCFLGVPSTHDYALRGYSVRIMEPGCAAVPDRIEGDVVATEKRDGVLSRAHLRLSMFAQSTCLSVAELRGAFVPSSVLKALMNKQYADAGAAEPVHARASAEAAEVAHSAGVLVGAPKKNSDGAWQATLLGPSVHDCFHHNAPTPDHVPGVMLFDACLQHAATVMHARGAPGAAFADVEFSLERFVQLDVVAMMQSTWEPSANGEQAMRVALSQRGHHCCGGTFRFTAPRS